MLNTSPLSATVRESLWRLRLLTLLVLAATAGVGVVFHVSTRAAWIQGMAAHLSAQTRVAAVILVRLPAQTPPDRLMQELDALQQTIPDALGLALFRSASGRTQVVAAVPASTAPYTADGLPAPGEVRWAFSGAVLSTVARLPREDGEPAYLTLQAHAATHAEVLRALALPYILLALAGILSALALRSYAQSGRRQMQNQIDRNRLALIELATHQLGAPIATFRWWLELLSDPENRDLLGNPEITDQISEAVDRMDMIIRSMSDASSLEHGAILQQQEVLGSLKHILQRVAESNAERLRVHRMRIEIRIDPAVRPVQLDISLLSGVLNELIDNAISYSPDGTVIRIFVEPGKDGATVSVVDQGHGIPEHDLPHMFEKFTRGSNAANFKPVGNGLGLFICRGIIQNLGGEMWMESKPEQGTAVHFTLPYAAGIEEQPA